MSPPRPQKRTSFKKVRSSVRYLKQTIFLSNCKGLRLYYRAFFGNNTVSMFYGRPPRKPLREELRSDYVHELAVFLNSEATKEKIRIAGIMLSAAH